MASIRAEEARRLAAERAAAEAAALAAAKAKPSICENGLFGRCQRTLQREVRDCFVVDSDGIMKIDESAVAPASRFDENLKALALSVLH